MAGATSTTLGTLVRPVVADDLTIVKFTNSAFLAGMRKIGMQDVRAMGDSAYRWKVQRSTGNSSVEVFTEGQAPLSAGSQSYVEAVQPWSYFRAIVSVTGHAMDFLGSHYLGEAVAGESALRGELPGAIAEIDDLVNTTLLGSGTTGLLNAIESTGTYAGLARATYSDWQSYEEAGAGGALTIAMLENTHEALRDNDRGARTFSAILMPENQRTNYATLVGAGASTSLVRYIADGAAPKLDAGYDDVGLSFHNIPIIGVPDMTDTEIAFITDAKADQPGEGWYFVTIRPIVEKELAVTDDTYKSIQISTGCTLAGRNPRKQGKVTNALA